VDELSTYEPFATAADFAAYARMPLNEFDTASAELYLAAASLVIRNACGWQVWPQLVDDELLVDGHGGRHLMLPASRVADVSSVTLHWQNADDTELDPSAYRWTRAGCITLYPTSAASFWGPGALVWDDWTSVGYSWPFRQKAATVIATHGFVNNPLDLKLLTCALAGRAFAGPLPLGRQQAGQVSVSGPKERSDGTLPGIDLTQNDMRRLTGYMGGYR
jgi:hypothetical protein